MTIRKSLGISPCVILASLAFVSVPAPASALDFRDYASTTPILYRYAACAFEADAPTAEEQIEQCASLKAELLLEAEEVIARFHVLERADVERELKRGIREIERDVSETRKRSKPVPKAIVGYLKCMGERVMVTPDYQSGDAVSYIGIESVCEAQHVEPARATEPVRVVSTINALYRRFQRFGRLEYPRARLDRRRSRSGLRLLPVKTMDRSFLNLSLIKRVRND